MNSVTLVGRIVSEPELEEFENSKKKTVIKLAVPRNYRNAEGIYETDFIRCTLWNGVAANTVNYCKKGDFIAVRGQIQTKSYTDAEQNTKYITEVIAQSVSFIASKDVQKREQER